MSGGGTGDFDTILRTTAFTAVLDSIHVCDVSSTTNINVTPPASPNQGDSFTIVIGRGFAIGKTVTVLFNSQLIYGLNDTFELDTLGAFATFKYFGGIVGWVMV